MSEGWGVSPGPSIDASEQSVISGFTNLSLTSRHTESTRSASSSRRSHQETCDTDRFRLSVEKLGVVGRDDEIRQLHDALAAVKTTGNSAFVVCRGPSGVGKSKLLESLRDPVFQQEGFFVCGKFDQLLNQQAPFSAISSTFSDLCDLLLQHEEKQTLVKALKARLGGSDIRALSRLIPSLGFLFEHQNSPTVEQGLEIEHSQQAYTKFKRLCRTFLEVVATAKHPIVLVLDDLQWADEGSLDLIQGLMKESLKHTLILCSYRTEEPPEYSHTHSDETQLGATSLEKLLEGCRSESFPLTLMEIMIGAFALDAINQMVSKITNRAEDETLPLSKVVLRKTHGNAFFCVHFLEMVEAAGLIRLTSSNTWEWDIEKIETETDATENVAELITGNLQQRAEPWSRLVLIYAAFLGYYFRADVLQQLVQAEATVDDHESLALDELWTISTTELPSTPNTVERALSTATAGNFVEGDTSGKSFKFSHDRVQACLLSMICDPNERASLYLRLGKSMQTLLTGETSDIEDVETIRFLSVDFLNIAGHLHSDPEKLDLAHLNLEVAELAASKGAYYSSRDYLRHAIVNLTNENWTTNYDLSLRVHELSAEMEHCTGFLTLSKERVDEVLKREKRKEDTTFVYQTYVASLANAGFLEEALSVGFDAMRHLNVKFPRPAKVNTAHVVVELVKTRVTVKRFTFDEILQLPEATDPGILMVFNIMSHVGLCSFHLGERGKSIFAVIALRAMRLSLTYGLVSLTSHALASYGAILSILGNITAACDFGELAQQVSTKLQAHDTEARMIVTNFCLLQHWHTPLKDLHGDLLRGHNLAMECADVTHGCVAFALYLDTAFCLGILPFSTIDEGARDFVELAREFGMWNLLPNVLATHQATINLMGGADGDPAMLNGDVANADNLIAISEETKNANSTSLIQFFQLVLAYHFENIMLLNKLVPLVEKGQRIHEGTFIQRFMLFYIGLSRLLLYDRTGRRRHRRRGTRVKSKFRSWHAKGYANSAPMMQILQMVHGGEKYCQDALNAAEEDGLGLNWAIAHERVAASMDDYNPDKRKHVNVAMDMYEKLDMHGKVDFLERRYGSVPSE